MASQRMTSIGVHELALPSGNKVRVELFTGDKGCESVSQYLVDAKGERIGDTTCTCSCTVGGKTYSKSITCSGNCGGCSCTAPKNPQPSCA